MRKYDIKYSNKSNSINKTDSTQLKMRNKHRSLIGLSITFNIHIFYILELQFDYGLMHYFVILVLASRL